MEGKYVRIDHLSNSDSGGFGLGQGRAGQGKQTSADISITHVVHNEVKGLNFSHSTYHLLRFVRIVHGQGTILYSKEIQFQFYKKVHMS